MARLTISFKNNEQELFDKVVNASCSPTSFIKDVLYEHFKNKENKKQSDIMYDDEII